MQGQTYSGTAVAFEGMTLPQIREPVAAGPGPGSMRAAEQALVEVSRTLADINAELEALTRDYAEAHEGEAAEITRLYLRKLGEPGRVGTVMFELAARALADQAEYYTVANRELTALQTTASYLGRTGNPHQAEERRQSAAHVANRYQENSNANLAGAFPAFAPLDLPTPHSAPVAPAAAPGWPGGVAAAAPPVSAASAAAPLPGTAADAPATPPVPVVPAAAKAGGPAGGGTGAPPPGVGGAEPSGAPRAARSTPPGAGPPTSWAPGAVPTPPAALGAPRGAAPADSLRPARTPPAPTGDRSALRPAPVELPPGVLGPTAPRSLGQPTPRVLGPGVLGGTAARPFSAAKSGRTAVPGGPEPGPRGVTGERVRVGEPWTEPARGGSVARTPSSHLPYLPAGVGGGRRGEPHPRPDWLVEDDPDGVWLVDVPEYGPGVLRGGDGSADGSTDGSTDGSGDPGHLARRSSGV
ncbi:hypothetical protein ACL02T_24375 [Pseudonocardia sp. RS010]|uniref:hypothetical protein n=1 Tax=Pseudonocardia sp. RS010 TaxID=3385979 RepID=UPI0039A0BE26